MLLSRYTLLQIWLIPPRPAQFPERSAPNFQASKQNSRDSEVLCHFVNCRADETWLRTTFLPEITIVPICLYIYVYTYDILNKTKRRKRRGERRQACIGSCKNFQRVPPSVTSERVEFLSAAPTGTRTETDGWQDARRHLSNFFLHACINGTHTHMRAIFVYL